MRTTYVSVTVDLDQIRASAEHVRKRTGVPLIAVVKADAYGLGAGPVADALAGVADDFAYFHLDEARAVGRPGLVMAPPDADPVEYRELNARPMIGTREQARRYAGLPVAVNLDTGMQRFGCPPHELDDLIERSTVHEITTHAATPAAVQLLRRIVGGRRYPMHAASTSLLDCPEAWFDAVRPGLALYRGAVRVTARLHSVRQTRGAAGYTGFECPRVGILLAGYSNGLQPAPVLINGRRQHILEVGMNTCFVSVDEADCAGDEVVLLGDGLGEAELAAHLRVREHEILCRYTSFGPRSHVTRDGAGHVRTLEATQARIANCE